MTRLAIISDVHADLHALRDALVYIERLGCDLIVCAGDLVDYGAQPEETVTLLRERKIPCIRGNHDRWSLDRKPDDPRALSPSAREFLASLPTRWDRTIEGVRVAVRHGTPRSDMAGIDPDEATAGDVWFWLREADADVLIVGHTHVPFALSVVGGGMIANPGALLREPIGGGTFKIPAPGTIGVLEVPARKFEILRNRRLAGSRGQESGGRGRSPRAI